MSVSNNAAASTGGSGGAQFVTMEERLKSLINRHKIMIFMKGTPDAPRCGFSRAIIEIIKSTGLVAFQIFSNDPVNGLLKVLHNLSIAD